MKSGSIIYDLAAIQGGNAAFTKLHKLVLKKVLKLWVKQIFLISCQFQHLICIQKMSLIL